MNIDFTPVEVDLLQDAVAELLSQYLVKGNWDNPNVRRHFDVLSEAGRKLGMEL